MPRQHGGAIRAVTRQVNRGKIEFELISVLRERFGGTIDDDRPDLLRLDRESIGTLRKNSGNVVAEIPDAQAVVSFQAYNPFVCGLPGADHGGELLKQLGELMAADDCPQPESTLPAAYTYLGQFIAHDVSRMRITDADEGGYNFRTPRLDLDSLFDGIDATATTPAPSVEHRGGLGLGLTAGAACNRNDLPRAVNGEAQIADARNDHNLAIAQFTLMMTRFYWKMLACHGNPADARRATINHFQHVVLYDYLCKVIDPDVYHDVVQNGPRIICRTPFLIPQEFALAAFRVGHSMIRDHYSDFSGSLSAGLTDLPLHTFLGGSLDRRSDNEYRLLNNWVVNWASLIDLPGFVPQPAMAIDDVMSVGLEEVLPWQFREIVNPDLSIRDPSTVVKGVSIRLPVQTLLRGRLASLPDAQTLHPWINTRLPATAQLPPALSVGEIAEVTSPDLKDFLEGVGSGFTTSTPLWFYCLRESARPPASGNHFGPLTSRIVMETIFTAIAEDPDGILTWGGAPRGFVPAKRLGNAAGTIGLREFISFAITP